MEEYDYSFPSELIATEPTSPRDSANLLVHKRKCDTTYFDKFINLTKYLPKDAILVFNETEVIPARLILTKKTGGKVKVLYIEVCQNLIKVLTDRKLEIGSKIYLNKKINFEVEKQEEKYYLLKPSFSTKDIYKILEKFGKTPIPPYIKNSKLNEIELREKYQSVFAKNKGSVAAPTASLHFTNRLLNRIKREGFGVKFITLHVNLGTFAPVTEENIKKSKLHSEYYKIDKETANFLNDAKARGRPIIAVGTTVVRTLESAANQNQMLTKLTGETQLFIKKGYRFKFVDGIITNFHVPKSSLLMLIAAFVGKEKLFELYSKAIEKKFKLFSFGDGMIVTH